MSVSDHLNTVRDVLNMAEVPYVDDFYRARVALGDAAAEHRAEVERLRGELAAAAVCEECGHTLGAHPRVALGERMPCSWEGCECQHFAPAALAAPGDETR